jgi:miniconductance mechanosensitive channel
MEFLDSLVESIFSQTSLSEEWISFFDAAFFILLLIIFSILANWVAKGLILSVVRKLVKKSKTVWDDVFLEKKVFHRMSHLAPVLVIYILGPIFMNQFPVMVNFIYMVVNVYISFVVLIVFYGFLDATGAIYNKYEISKTKPIKGYLQVTKIITGLVAAIFALSFVLDKSPVYLFTGLGAITAILLLIFKDTILGFVAGVQVSANNLVQIGDWIEMPKYGADGDVIDISLHTVTIRNFDRTYTTIPTYVLVSDSFKNWRGMVQTGGRRIMRDVYIDINTIKFCNEEMLQKFESVRILKEYIAEKRVDIEKYNLQYEFDSGIPANGRRLTNIGTFRAYVLRYLQNHPKIHKDLTCMVRQMPPTEKGVPLQIYAFTNDINWVNYEGIQSDIFDHFLSVITFFDLKVFQFPAEISVNLGDNAKTGK